MLLALLFQLRSGRKALYFNACIIPVSAAGRRGFFASAAAAASLCVGVPGNAAAAPPEDLYLSRKPIADTFVRFRQDGSGAEIMRANLSTRVVRLPQEPKTCHGAQDGDFLSIRYAVAYEFRDGDRKIDVKENDAEVDLLEDTYSSARWQVFDDSDRRGGLFRLPLGDGNAIPGVELGLQGMCVGERRVLYIPPSLGYGGKGSKDYGVPPFAPLRFDVELQDVMQISSGPAGGGNRRVMGQLLE